MVASGLAEGTDDDLLVCCCGLCRSADDERGVRTLRYKFGVEDSASIDVNFWTDDGARICLDVVGRPADFWSTTIGRGATFVAIEVVVSDLCTHTLVCPPPSGSSWARRRYLWYAYMPIPATQDSTRTTATTMMVMVRVLSSSSSSACCPPGDGLGATGDPEEGGEFSGEDAIGAMGGGGLGGEPGGGGEGGGGIGGGGDGGGGDGGGGDGGGGDGGGGEGGGGDGGGGCGTLYAQ